MINELEKKEYIMLDWNVIQYLKNSKNPLSQKCRHLIEKLYSKYEFPFCISHLRDLAKGYSESKSEFIYEDLNFLNIISHNTGIEDRDNKFYLVKCSAIESFKEIIKYPLINLTFEPNKAPQITRKIDFQLLSENNPMRSFLEKNNGIYGPTEFDNWVEKEFELMKKNEIECYKKLRAFMSEFKSNFLKHDIFFMSQYEEEYAKHFFSIMEPFFNALEVNDKEVLLKIWPNAVASFLEPKYHETIPFSELIQTAYFMLDCHPLFSERLKKGKNSLLNMSQDAMLLYYSSFSTYLITEDKKFYKKAEFIFKSFKLYPKVLSIQQFIDKFNNLN